MRVLILGGGGFLGRNLTKALIDKNVDVRVFELSNGKKRGLQNKGKNIEWFYGNFMNQIDLKDAISGCEYIYHLISTTIPKTSNENPVYDVESNLIPSIYLLELAKTNNIKKIIFVSSGGTVYGIPKKIPIIESHPTEPMCSYGITKLAIEKYFGLFHANGGPNYSIIRLANPYGNMQSSNALQGVISVFMNKAINDDIIEIWGDGSVVRDYIYIDDVIDALLLSLEYHGTEKIFNIGSGIGYSLNNIIDSIEKTLHKKTIRIYSSERDCDIPVNVLGIEKATKHLGWLPKTKLIEGLKKTAEFYKHECYINNPKKD